MTWPGVLRSALSIDIPATHNPLNISQVFTNIGKIAGAVLHHEQQLATLKRRYVAACAQGVVPGGTRCGDGGKERRRRGDGQNPKSRRPGGCNLWGWKKVSRSSEEAENKARALVDALWNQNRAVQKKPAEYEKIQVRLEHKKRKSNPLTMKRKRKELVIKLPKRAGSWGATGEGMQHDFAVLVTRGASENSPVKNYPKKQGSRSEPEVDVDVCTIDIRDSLASRTLDEVLALEEGWEVVKLADRTKWCVCMYTAMAAVVTAAGTRPKDWAKMVHKKASAGFAITNRKCKHII